MQFRSFLIILSAIGFVSNSSIAQDAQYGRGLLLDYYVIETKDQALEPTGRSMATLLDTSAPQMSYLSPFEIEPALNQFNDQFWGLHWSGFLSIESGGAHSFNLLFNISGPSDETNLNYGAECSSWLKVQDRKLVEHELKFYPNGNSNSYGDLQLRPGIYAIEAWLSCIEAGRYIDDDGETAAMQIAKPSLTINMRGPEDAMLKPIPKDQLLHEL